MWVTVHGGVYDLTKYLKFHPGGVNLILRSAGLDVSKDFEAMHHSPKARAILERYRVGSLAGYVPSPVVACGKHATDGGKGGAGAGAGAGGGGEQRRVLNILPRSREKEKDAQQLRLEQELRSVEVGSASSAGASGAAGGSSSSASAASATGSVPGDKANPTSS